MLTQLQLFMLRNKNKINSLVAMSESIANFAITKSKFSLVNGALKGMDAVLNTASDYPYKFFGPAEGWVHLSRYKPINGIFVNIINELPCSSIPFPYETVKSVVSPVGQMIVITGHGQANGTIMVQEKKREKVLNFLGGKKIEELKTSFMSFNMTDITENNTEASLFPLKLNPMPSDRSASIIKGLEKAFEEKINRSLLFFGLPGTGKTTLSQTIIAHFGMRTLKVHPNEKLQLPLLLELIDTLKIEALILDDFDQIKMNDKTLEILELLNKRMKLTIGIANVLGGFDPAVLRPGRFDEIIQVEELEEKTVRGILGELSDPYFEKVKAFPVAYIQELVKQNKLNPEILEEKFENLNDRVKQLKEAYKIKKQEHGPSPEADDMDDDIIELEG